MKSKLHEIVIIRPALLYRVETWAIKVKELRLLEKTELRMQIGL